MRRRKAQGVHIYLYLHANPHRAADRPGGLFSRCWRDRNCWGEVAAHAECAGHEGGGLPVHTSSLHPHNIQPESREFVAAAQQRSKERDPLTREWSREEGSGEIQEGISEEEACSWALMDKLDGSLSGWAGGGDLKSRVQHLPTLFFIPLYLACIINHVPTTAIS